jgi:outer membrane protein assembly factor BamE
MLLMDFLSDISGDKQGVAPNDKLHPTATMIHHIVTPTAMSALHRSPILTGLIVTACVMLTACAGSITTAPRSSASFFSPTTWLTPFRADVVQGNFISSEQVGLLRAGMSRNDVRNVLGTPLLASVFHADRWDYVFTLRRQGVPAQAFSYAVFFKGDLLDTFSGDAMPSETEFIAQMDQRRNLGKVPPLEATPAQLEAAAKKMAAPTPTAEVTRAQPPTASYPPLESPRQ